MRCRSRFSGEGFGFWSFRSVNQNEKVLSCSEMLNINGLSLEFIIIHVIISTAYRN